MGSIGYEETTRAQTMNDALVVKALSIVPKRLGSRWMGRFARTPLWGVLNRALLRWYVRTYDVNLDEIEGTIEDYPSLAEFFVRALREGARTIDPEPRSLVSPVDGAVASVGVLEGTRLRSDTGADLDIAEMLGSADGLSGGSFAVLYLSPRDYHRVHSPAAGQVVGYRYRPGAFWPVFPAAVRRYPDLFARNERLVIRLATQEGPELAVVMVGAYGVGRMTTSFCELTTNTGQSWCDEDLSPAAGVERGGELGRFNLGSTVILVAPPDTLDWELEPGQRVEFGRRIARFR